MPKILSGIAVRDELKKALMNKASEFAQKNGFSLTLAIIQVGDRPDSTAYINAKKKFAETAGIRITFNNFPENAVQAEVVAEIQKLNLDQKIAGIIVQLPLPAHMEKHAVIDAISPEKDTDAITSVNVKKWTANISGALWPATARGIGELFDFYGISLAHKKVCVLGRSELVGTPIAAMCRSRGAVVTVCHSGTKDALKQTSAANVIISAVGKPGLVTAAHVRAGQVVIDVGINRIPDDSEKGSHLSGDADFEKVSAVLGESGSITPVPGGVGPMTVLALFENLADCAKMQIK